MTYGTRPVYAPPMGAIEGRTGDLKAEAGGTSATEGPQKLQLPATGSTCDCDYCSGHLTGTLGKCIGPMRATGLAERVSANERQIQEAVWDYLNKCAVGGLNRVGGVIACHPKNGGPQQATAGQRLANARQGVVAGIPDLILWHGSKSYWLELKTLKGTMTAAQQSIAHVARCGGINTACAYGIDEACAILRRWGLTKGEVQ